MIFAFSTSSIIASVAIFGPDGDLLFEASQNANQDASNACLALLAQSGRNVLDGSLFLADLGPGSFTGTRVGVTLAKSLAFAAGAQCGGADAFDLVSAAKTVVFPSKKGEWFVRRIGTPPVRQLDLPSDAFVGFGPGIATPAYPEARNFGLLFDQIQPVAPELLVPDYLIEPAISVPKKPLGRVSQ